MCAGRTTTSQVCSRLDASVPELAAQRGRHRYPAINDAILTATRELLLDLCYVGLSMEAVAARPDQQTHPVPAIPQQGCVGLRGDLGKTKSVALPDTGYLIADLQEAYDWAVDEFAAPEAYARVHGLVERAQRRGEMRPDADLTLAIDVFTGTALARATLLDHPVDYAFGARLVELLVAGPAPRPADP